MVDFSSLFGRGISSAPFVFGTAGTTISKQIAASSDDLEQNEATGGVAMTSTDLELCRDGGLNLTVGLRFLAVGIPPGATITNAYVQFVADRASLNDVPTLTIAGENVDSAAAFTTTAFSVTSRARTTATVAWSPPQWVNAGDAGEAQQTPNISTIIQEIVNRPGYTSSSNIVIFVYDDNNNTMFRSAVSFNGNAANAPTLVVTYS